MEVHSLYLLKTSGSNCVHLMNSTKNNKLQRSNTILYTPSTIATQKNVIFQIYQNIRSGFSKGHESYRLRTILCCNENLAWQSKQNIASGMRSYRFRKVFSCLKNSQCHSKQDTALGTRSYRFRRIL